MKPDRVLTINDYYDGPRLGVAELNGIPHIYEAEFDHSGEEFGDTYFLSPIDPELLELVLEDWAIFCRWDLAYKRKEVAAESHPALPHELGRHEELKKLIGDRLRCDSSNRAYYRAKFGAMAPELGWSGTLVMWQPLPN